MGYLPAISLLARCCLATPLARNKAGGWAVSTWQWRLALRYSVLPCFWCCRERWTDGETGPVWLKQRSTQKMPCVGGGCLVGW